MRKVAQGGASGGRTSNAENRPQLSAKLQRECLVSVFEIGIERKRAKSKEAVAVITLKIAHS